MAQGFTLELKGLQETLKRLDKAGGDISREVDAEMADSALKIEGKAARAARNVTSRLFNSISQEKVANLRYEIVAAVRYAPYVEFGTGGLVKIPPGLEAYAAQFKGKGIRKVNLPARPFMFPAAFSERKPLIEAIKKVLSRKR